MSKATIPTIKELRALNKAYLLAMFGNRCPEHDPECLNCQVWRAFDEMFPDSEPHFTSWEEDWRSWWREHPPTATPDEQRSKR